MKQRKPRVKVNTYMELSTQDRCIHLANGGALRWQTPLSRPFNRGRICKNEGRTMQNCRKHIGGFKKKTYGAAQAKSEGQNIHGVFQYKTCAYFLQVGGVTLRWHTMLSTDAGIAALVLNSFGVFSHYDGTRKGGGGPRIPSYATVFVEGYERLLDGINASFCVCHLTVNPYIYIYTNIYRCTC